MMVDLLGSGLALLAGSGSEIQGWLAAEVREIILTGRGELRERAGM